MQTIDTDFEPFEPNHLSGALALSRQAGWPHRLEDWQMALALSEGRVTVDARGNVMGTVLVTPYKCDCATINMVIVDEALRGQGIGRRLMNEALQLAGDRPARLVATAEGLPLYEKLGFRQTGTIVQYQGLIADIAQPDGVEVAAATDIPAILELDRLAFNGDRESLIAYLANVGTFALIRREGRVEAFAAIRRFGRGEVIGPVVATDLDDAEALIAYFAASRLGSFLRVDTNADTGLVPFLQSLGLVQVGGGIAMTRPAPGKTAVTSTPSRYKTFALASQALG